jgi:hypothetical protein
MAPELNGGARALLCIPGHRLLACNNFSPFQLSDLERGARRKGRW